MSEDQAKPKPLWIVLDKNGNPWGPFETTDKACQFAYEKWPHPATAADFHVVALRHPDEFSLAGVLMPAKTFDPKAEEARDRKAALESW